MKKLTFNFSLLALIACFLSSDGHRDPRGPHEPIQQLPPRLPQQPRGVPAQLIALHGPRVFLPPPVPIFHLPKHNPLRLPPSGQRPMPSLLHPLNPIRLPPPFPGFPNSPFQQIFNRPPFRPIPPQHIITKTPVATEPIPAEATTTPPTVTTLTEPTTKTAITTDSVEPTTTTTPTESTTATTTTSIAPTTTATTITSTEPTTTTATITTTVESTTTLATTTASTEETTTATNISPTEATSPTTIITSTEPTTTTTTTTEATTSSTEPTTLSTDLTTTTPAATTTASTTATSQIHTTPPSTTLHVTTPSRDVLNALRRLWEQFLSSLNRKNKE
ncbi:cell wall protein DAN4-like [Phyllostomus hastatus]|uniref:cell wall protein DAN4-like n=1 Tax=Phyllostomus hastatus TaxID=9423 RepID=UPI001E67F218|nr:cell wall protein DAN4-like [Phyllostomus hastatus]